jgi:hypothetical protein
MARRQREEEERRQREEAERQAALQQSAPGDEEARRLADEQARRDAAEQARQRELADLRERRRTPEGFARVLFEAMQGLRGELFAACWLDVNDLQFLFGPRGQEQGQLVRRARGAAWDTYRRQSTNAELSRATFVRLEATVRNGRKGPEIVNGQVVYQVDGQEKTIPLAQLYQVEDGSWKAYKMLP